MKIPQLFRVSASDPELIPAARKLTLDEAHQLACRIGQPEIGGWNGAQAASLKLNEQYSDCHYISLRCGKFQSAAENLMECVRVAEQIRGALS